MTEPLVNKDQILDYIPQRNPIVMVHEILNCNAEGIQTSFNIAPDNMFVSEGFLQEPGVIENIAQTAAAMTGYKAKQENTDVKRGFIGSVKGLKIYDLPKTNDTIITEVKIVTEVMNATVIEGTVKLGENVVANCQMNIFLEE